MRRIASCRSAAAVLAALVAFVSPSAAPAADLSAGSATTVASARELLAEAERLRFAEDWYPAIESYLAAAAKNPSYGEAYSGLAECYYQLGEYDQALSYIRKAAPLRRGDTALVNLEGFVRIGLGDLAGARKAFDSVRAALPNDLDSRFGLSLLDLSAGKKTEARGKLEESLRLSPQNGRALLSLALIASDQGKKEEAQALVEKALRYHGGEPKTQYVAASLAAASGDLEKAAFHARNALDQKPGYAEARLLLGSIMYQTGSYDQAVALMREAIARDRKDGMAWYTLGLAQEGAGRHADAVYSLKTAVSLRPDDELARMALELVVMESTNAEEASRAAYANWHVARGREFEDRSSYDQAIFEYRRALRIYPYSKEARLGYADMLKARGFPGKYLSELQFLQGNGAADQSVLDQIEIYGSLLVDEVGQKWGIEEESLPKRPYRLAVMYQPSPGASAHANGQALLLRYIEDIISSSSRASLLRVEPAVSSFAEAFRRAREAEADYFALLTVRETERDVEFGIDLRVARTGSPATSFTSYRTGNDRVKNAASRTAKLLVEALPPQGSLLMRSQDRVLVDLGKSEGVAAGDKLVIVKKGSVKPKPEGLGIVYPQDSVLGEIDVGAAGEEASEGSLKRSGFFDAVNVGDQVVLAPAEEQAAAKAGAVSPNAPTAKAPAKAPAKGASAEPQKEWPGLFSAVRALR